MDIKNIARSLKDATKEGGAGFYTPVVSERVRILADNAWDTFFWKKTHHFVAGTSVMCLANNEALGIPKQRCPICQAAAELKRSPDAADKEAGRQLRAQTRYVIFVIVRNKEKEGPKIWELSGKALGYLKEAMLLVARDEDGNPTGEEILLELWNYSNGYDLTVKENKDSPGFEFKYPSLPSNQPQTSLKKALTEDEFYKMIDNPPELYRADQVKTAAELKKLLMDIDDGEEAEVEVVNDDLPARGSFRGTPTPPPRQVASNPGRPAGRTLAPIPQETAPAPEEYPVEDYNEEAEDEIPFDQDTGEVYDESENVVEEAPAPPVRPNRPVSQAGPRTTPVASARPPVATRPAVRQAVAPPAAPSGPRTAPPRTKIDDMLENRRKAPPR